MVKSETNKLSSRAFYTVEVYSCLCIIHSAFKVLMIVKNINKDSIDRVPLVTYFLPICIIKQKY